MNTHAKTAARWGMGAFTLTLCALAGIQAAIHRNRFQDTAIIVVLVAGLSIPNFATIAFAISRTALSARVWRRCRRPSAPNV